VDSTNTQVSERQTRLVACRVHRRVKKTGSNLHLVQKVVKEGKVSIMQKQKHEDKSTLLDRMGREVRTMDKGWRPLARKLGNR